MQMVFLCTPIIICVIIYCNVEVESIFFSRLTKLVLPVCQEINLVDLKNIYISSLNRFMFIFICILNENKC